MMKKTKHIAIAVEFFILCIALPTIIIYFNLGFYMFFFLWSATAYCAYQLFYVGDENFAKDTWKWHQVNKENMKPMLIRWVLGCVGMVAFLYWYEPSHLFAVASKAPFQIIMIFTIYPILSALPQELIFCSFFFHRYKIFFKTENTRIWASAIVFAYAHVLYINPVAPILSLIGGLIFAKTYAQTRSLALVTIEHALYGNALFFIGLGIYFWSGALA